jgi:hypothetical protein
MALCKLCGQSAGIFRHEHTDCRKKFDEGCDELMKFFVGYLTSDITSEHFRDLVNETAEQSLIRGPERERAIGLGISKSIAAAVEDRVLTDDELLKIANLVHAFEFDIAKSRFGYLVHIPLSQALTLRDLDRGVAQSHTTFSDLPPIALQRGEEVLWMWYDVTHYGLKKTAQWVAGSQGVSLRLMKGVYFRAGATKGQRVEASEVVVNDVGNLVVTQHNIYFHGNRSSLRLALRKIVSVETYSDGIGIMMEAAQPKPQIFKLTDQMFAANLILKAAHV